MGDVDRWRVHPGDAVRLEALDPGSTAGAPGDRQVLEAAVGPLSDDLFSLQSRLWAEAKRSLLVVLQGMDASGKDGTIKHVFRGVNPQGTRVVSFKEPTHEELAHDFLWRVHARTPAAGEIGVFNRSHYEDVVVVRVHGDVSDAVVHDRYGHIRSFEELLGHSGTTVVKCFLHISFEEQGRRLQRRVDDPERRWKAQPADFAERRMWSAYQDAYQRAIEHTSTAAAPWYVVPSDHKWYRNWVISQILIHTLEEMDPRYPDVPPPDPAEPD